jgi:RNA polymerase sigma factor (sigma-70 family)
MSTVTPPPITPRVAASSARDDRALLAAVRQGERAAMGELFVRHRDHVRRYVASLGWSGSADEVVSETFARTLRAIRNGAGPIDHPRRYLFATARSVVIARGAQERRRQAADRAFAHQVLVASVGDESMAVSAVVEAFGALPARQQTALWMTEVEGRPASEVGEVLGITQAAVYALGLRSRRSMLRAYLAATTIEGAVGATVADRMQAARVGVVGAGPAS